jgi:FMN phosphatase YigB (HAD superfamily)
MRPPRSRTPCPAFRTSKQSMKIYKIPERPIALLFDIDSTLYTNDAYAEFQNDVLVDELAKVRGVSSDDIWAELDKVRADYAARTGGGKTSLGNAMLALGVPLTTSVEWRQKLIVPEDWLSRDERLIDTLCDLANGFKIAAVTNNPKSVGKAALKALGVAQYFQEVVGLDDTYISKPAREPFLLAASILDTAPESCISIGDRYDVDLAVPLELGMGGILVQGVEDVYELNATVLTNNKS